MAKVEDMLGATLSEVVRGKDTSDEEFVAFTADDGRSWRMFHVGDCCESVDIESINGDLSDLVGVPLTLAEESTSEDTPSDVELGYTPESQTWTFYRFATCKGHVDIRWWGTSNGYYSESVTFTQVKP